MVHAIYTTTSSVVCVDENGKTEWQMGVEDVAAMRVECARLTEENTRLREALEQTRGALMSEGVGSPEWHDAIMAADAALVKGEACV